MKIVPNKGNAGDWSLTFSCVSEGEPDSTILLSVLKDEKSLKEIMFLVKAQHGKHPPSDYIIDIRDANHDIQDYCFVTHEEMQKIAHFNGYKLNDSAKPDIRRVK